MMGLFKVFVAYAFTFAIWLVLYVLACTYLQTVIENIQWWIAFGVVQGWIVDKIYDGLNIYSDYVLD